MASDRCGYTHHTSRYPEKGALTCWRATHEDCDRCIWHLDASAKSPEALAAESPNAGERLDGAILRGVAIPDCEWLEGASLIGTDFEKANLEGVSLREADLRDAEFDGAHAKDADFDGTILDDATFDSTKLQGASFHGARLKDTEFYDTRISQDTEFDAVDVHERTLDHSEGPDELRSKFDAATWVYRQIQSISRRNALLDSAEYYYYREKDLRRRFAWRCGNYSRAIQAEGARWLMGYGRNPWRIIGVSAAVVGLCALFFPFVGGLLDTASPDPVTYSLQFPPVVAPDRVATILGKSLYFSVVTFGTLGSGGIQPVGTAARFLAGVETLVGFGLIALLISVMLRRGSWL